MYSIRDKTYKMKDHSINNLISSGFDFDRRKNSDGRKCYSISFPVLKYNNGAVITGEITVNAEDGNIMLDVYDVKGNTYAPFYCNEYGNYKDILEIINRNIIKQMKKSGIKKAAGGRWKTK